MENENKVEEVSSEQVDNISTEPIVSGEQKINEPEAKKCCRGICKGNCKVGKFFQKNKTAVAIVVLLILIAASVGYKYLPKKTDIGPVAAKEKITKFISENLVQPGTKVDISELTEENGLYKMDISVASQKITAYMTKDGSKFFPQMIDLNEDASKNADPAKNAVPEKTEAEAKTDVPTVDLFVMSYCPYGLQMERGILPAIESLGNKIKFNLKFVNYTLHGQKEVDENVRQYCVQKTQPAKLDSYLKCFWKDSKGTSDVCMKNVGINAAQIASCVSETNKQFNPSEKAFNINKEETDKFGVQGSPTLVVNGTTIASGRDSASVLKAICSGFSNQPKECSAKLSSTSPVAGFDDQASASKGNSAPASCGTQN